MTERKTGVQTQVIHRVLDANWNRAKEGLRVCEDICRFVLDNAPLTEQYKRVRHQLTHVMAALPSKKMLKSRDIAQDVGKPSIQSELRRKDIQDIFYANSQRSKESVRVLEEFSKLIGPKAASELKGMRYTLYAIEKDVAEKF
jgi:thiamine-phosphate pyrophosphorylase